ncbi:hypothetical protein PMIN07_005853, partial [Paraphaeosphaeria minitans]
MQCLQSAMWDFILKRKFKFVPLNDKDADDDMDRENLLPSGAQPRIRRGLSWHLFVLCIVSTACLSVILGAWIGNATRWDADAFSIRHTSQYYSAALIPPLLAARSGLAPDQVKIKERYGGGYPAHVEGMHHLHCLNLLRKSLAWNFAYYQAEGLGPFSNDKDILKHHVSRHSLFP